MDDLKKLIREVPDYPKPGILFYDLTTLLKDKQGFHTLIDRLCDHYKGHTIDVVAGIEARGFIFAPALAYRLGAGFVPVRKPKKLPAKTASISYALEYGTDTLEIHEDAVKPGASRDHLRRSARNGRHGRGHCKAHREARRKSRRRSVRGRADVSQRPLETQWPGYFLADSIRQVAGYRLSARDGRQDDTVRTGRDRRIRCRRRGILQIHR